MSVKWKPVSTKSPQADYNDFSKWMETNKYRELMNQKPKESEKKKKKK